MELMKIKNYICNNRCIYLALNSEARREYCDACIFSMLPDAEEQPLSRINYDEIKEDYNNTLGCYLPKIVFLNDTRKKAIRTAEKMLGTLTWHDYFKKVYQSDFLTGRDNHWHGCGFDWIIKPANMTKVIEGNYEIKSRTFENNSFDINELFAAAVQNGMR